LGELDLKSQYKMKRKIKFIVKPLIALKGGSLEDFEKTIMENKKIK
jgi:hypothetical protein